MRNFPGIFSITAIIVASWILAAAPANATCVGGSCSFARPRPTVSVLRAAVRGPVRVVQVVRHRERVRILSWRRCSRSGCGCE